MSCKNLITIMAEYKGIYIDRDAFQEKLAKFQADTTIKIIETLENSKFKKFVVTVPGYEVESTISYWEVAGGKVTLSLNECKNKELGKKLLEYVVQETQFSSKLQAPIYIKDFSQEKLDELLAYIDVYSIGKIVDTKKRPNGVTTVVEGPYGDQCQLNYFTNSAFNIQGKSGLLKSKLVEALSEFLPFSDIVQATLDSYEVKDLDKSEAEKLLDARIPTATSYLNPTVKAILIPAIITYRLEIETTDYSFMSFASFRALEGFLKQILFEHNTPISDNFGEKFDKNSVTHKYFLKPNVENVVNCQYTKAVLEKGYNYLKQNRHIHFHVDGTIAGTTLIEDISVVRGFIDDIFDTIESSVRCIKEKNLNLLR